MAKISCPVCQQSDQVFKVSQIYVEGISKEPVADSNLIATVLNYPPEKKWTGFPSAGEQKFLKMFAPPSGSTAITRPINPDIVVGAFSIVAVFMTLQVIRTQPGALWIILVLLALFYLAYFLRRKQIQNKYQSQLQDMTNATTATEAAVGRWMKMYYCVRDEVVFEPGKDRTEPVEEMDRLLYQ